MKWLILANEGLRMFKRARKIKNHGLPKYKGNAKEICEQIIEACWDNKNKYFRVSTANYPVFYCRDFGMVIDSLLKLGNKKKVTQSLEYALTCFSKHNKITTSINPKGKPFDFPTYAPDSLAFLLYSLNALGDEDLIDKYRHFLNKEIYRFCNKVVDMSTGLPKKEHFSSMKDYSIRTSSCYDLCMCYMVQKFTKKFALVNPLNKFDYKKLLLDHYWEGDYFLDDLSGKKYIAGDANVLVFWSGLIKDKKMIKKVMSTLQKHKLDKPFPLKYTHEDNKEVDMHWLELFAKDWEKHVSWLHLGYMYITVVKSVNKKKSLFYLNQYKDSIEKFKNHLEVFQPNKKPYQSRFYYSSDSMIWAANYLGLK